MTSYAVIDGGVIVGRRDIADWDNYPAHKKAARDERGDGGPTLRPIVYAGSGPIEDSIAIGIDAVTITMADPPPAPAPPAEVIRIAYLKAALAEAGELARVDAAVTDPVLRALWEYAADIRRDDRDIIAMATALSIDLDALWRRAREIRVERGLE